MGKRKSNKKVKQMICGVLQRQHFGEQMPSYLFKFDKQTFGFWVYIKSGWFFREWNDGVVSLTAEQMKK